MCVCVCVCSACRWRVWSGTFSVPALIGFQSNAEVRHHKPPYDSVILSTQIMQVCVCVFVFVFVCWCVQVLYWEIENRFVIWMCLAPTLADFSLSFWHEVEIVSIEKLRWYSRVFITCFSVCWWCVLKILYNTLCMHIYIYIYIYIYI